MKVLKWIGIVVLVLVVVVVIAGAIGYFTANSRLAKAPDVPVATVAIPDDAASIERGEHIAMGVTACIGCHGEQLEGDGLHRRSAHRLRARTQSDQRRRRHRRRD